MQKAIVLFSGGLDSTTCLALAKSQGFAVYALSFSYGQKHHAEINAAEKVAKYFQVIEHRRINIDLSQFGGSALTDPELDIPDHANDDAVPLTYVPARNTIFLSYGLAWAEVMDCHDIFIGISAIDYSGYPDCRPEYLAAFQQMANLATKASVTDRGVVFHAPLINLSKAETIKLGIAHGVDYAMTVSCYRANDHGLACGECDSCVLRKQGFHEAGIVDPTRYHF